jgi:hypothetical protein
LASRPQFDLKRFRSQVAELKRKGLIKNVDARTAQPFFIRQGKPLKDVVKKYDDVLSGKVQPVKLPPKKIKELGYTKTKVGKDSYAMVPISAGEKVRVEKGTVKIVEPKGIERIKHAIPFTNLREWLTKMKRSHRSIDKLKAPNEWYTFKVFGRRSWQGFESIDDLIDKLRSYESWQATMNYGKRKQRELWEHLEIIRVPDLDRWHTEKEKEVQANESKKKRKQKSWVKRMRKRGKRKS